MICIKRLLVNDIASLQAFFVKSQKLNIFPQTHYFESHIDAKNGFLWREEKFFN